MPTRSTTWVAGRAPSARGRTTPRPTAAALRDRRRDLGSALHGSRAATSSRHPRAGVARRHHAARHELSGVEPGTTRHRGRRGPPRRRERQRSGPVGALLRARPGMHTSKASATTCIHRSGRGALSHRRAVARTVLVAAGHWHALGLPSSWVIRRVGHVAEAVVALVAFRTTEEGLQRVMDVVDPACGSPTSANRAPAVRREIRAC